MTDDAIKNATTETSKYAMTYKSLGTILKDSIKKDETQKLRQFAKPKKKGICVILKNERPWPHLLTV